jgi:hypothetical protein
LGQKTGEGLLLHLNFLNKTYKAVTPPLVVFTEEDGESNVGAFYCIPQHNEHLIDGKYYPARHGIIVIDESCCSTNTELAASLAHEYRHHLQHYYGVKYDHKDWGALYKRWGYEVAIKRYFRQSRTEMDALIFQRRYAGGRVSEYTEYWCELLAMRSNAHPRFFFPLSTTHSKRLTI